MKAAALRCVCVALLVRLISNRIVTAAAAMKQQLVFTFSHLCNISHTLAAERRILVESTPL